MAEWTEISRRGLIGGIAAAAALTGVTPAQASTPLVPAPPIGRPEHLARLAKARALMQRHGIGAVLIEPGASLDYFTGVQWWRSERLTAVVIPVSGDPIVVTPFFEKPSVEESLGIPAEVRVWQEDEEPLKLVADFLRERGLANQPVGFEETNRFFILDKLQQHLPGVKAVSANPVVRGCRMIKSPAELALMQHAADINVAALARTARALKVGMPATEVERLYSQAVTDLGGVSGGGLVLFGPASALPHGTGKPQALQHGDVVLLDCGCSVHGYQADNARTFVFGADPTAEQRKVWQQMRRGQDIAMAAAKVGAAAGSVDDAVRASYEGWGYGPGYRLPGLSHRTGHGIGMEGHEPVNLVQGESTPLAPGMCFSNEPGIYLPGKFGVRLEDCFFMTAAGPKWFTVPPSSIDQPFG
ncbi:Xaa-Pro peptidase family protein [Sphingomonas sp.]|uniref:M24 family metallopeptidase n=1 Tax=Sphingomonas sp. TaxID=28214 RepID=UPI00286DE5E3|nr:Xaa-Pro peptidase family protein [Sphingomonas sp.]